MTLQSVGSALYGVLLGFSKNSNHAEVKKAGYKGHFSVSFVSNPYGSNVIG